MSSRKKTSVLLNKTKSKTKKMSRYILYDGIGAKKSGKHTEQEFLNMIHKTRMDEFCPSWLGKKNYKPCATYEGMDSKMEKYAAKYEINMLRCIFCGLCEEACPKDAIYLSETFAPANYTRKGFIYGKPDLLIPNPMTEASDLALARGVEA